MIPLIMSAVLTAVLFAASAAYAHGIDEGPGLGTGITIVMVVSWIVIALGLVFFVLRVIRPNHKERDRDK